ncbi:MAG TPA: hypothetical protein VE988_20630, partial [Gemmataceae bacterium]|nr:hypothetical protein [Gemmataceae bacterium]
FLFFPFARLYGIFLSFWPIFALGIVLAFLFERKLTLTCMIGRKAAPFAAVACLGMIAGFVLYIIGGYHINSLAFALFFGVFLYAAGPVDSYYLAKVYGSKRTIVRGMVSVAMAFGAMSYSLYLIHGRVQFLSMQFVRQVINTNTILFDALVIALTCGFCYCFYLICERPFMGNNQPRQAADVSSTERGSAPLGAPTVEAVAV